MQTTTNPHIAASRQLAAVLLLAALLVGSAMLWIVIPIACLWLSAKASDSLAQHFLLALPMTIAAMSAWMVLLAWLNQLYLDIVGVRAQVELDAKAGWNRRRVRGPLERMMIVWFFVALAAMFFWFFFLAHDVSRQVI